MKVSGSCRVAALVFAWAAGVLGSMTAQPAARPVRLADIYAEESFSRSKDWSVAGDGALAFVVERAIGARRNWREVGKDVCVQLASPGQPKCITDSASDGGSWTNPLWSPDGLRLLLTSTRSGTYGLWMWERNGGLRQLSARALSNEEFGDARIYYEWAGNAAAIAAFLPEGVSPPLSSRIPLEPMRQAKAGWDRYLAGEVSVSVLDNDSKARVQRPAAAASEGLRQLIRIDVSSGESLALTDVYRPAVSSLYLPLLSDDGCFLAVPVYGPPPAGSVRDFVGAVTLKIVRIDGKPLALDKALPADVLQFTPVWSPDSKQLAFLAFGASRTSAPRLVRVDVAHGHVREQSLGELVFAHARDDIFDLARLEWTGTGELVGLAGRGEQALRKYARRDWWLLPSSGAPRNLTAHMTQVPQFQRYSPSGPLLGLAEGRLWKLDAARGAAIALTEPGVWSRPRIVWPQSAKDSMLWGAGRKYLVSREERPQNGSVVVRSTDAQLRSRYVKVEWASGRLTPLNPPRRDAAFERLGPQADTAYWTSDELTSGYSLWRTAASAGAPAERVFALNEWRSAIAAAPDITIEYTSLYGDPYTAWIQLPVGYEPGKRYPLIAIVYPGRTVEPIPHDHFMRIASAAGFAVLRPQMGPKDSTRRYGMVSRDPYFEVPHGVLPAVDKAVALGIADNDRLFVEGWSMGGFATYALIEQTTRFRAALAGAGIGNWSNGSFSERGRYGDDVTRLNIGWLGENVQQRPAAETLWSDLGLFQRNSPIQYAERIQTPLMIVHGSMDTNVPMNASEEMFSALVQLDKRTRFVRYWGEDHIIESIYGASPENERDLWRQRLAWFDEFGDMRRDGQGRWVFEGSRVKSRAGAAVLKPEDYDGFDLFLPRDRQHAQ